MSRSETIYTPRFPYQEVLQRGRAQVTTITVYLDGAVVPETSGTVDIYRPDGSLLVSAGVVAAGSYSVTPAATEPLGEGYRIEWHLLMPDTVIHTFTRDCAVSLVRLYPVVTDQDLIDLYPDLASERPPTATSWQPQLDEAWAVILDRLSAEGVLPYLVVTPNALRQIHKHSTLAMIYAYLWRNTSSESRKTQWDYHREEHAAAWARLTLKTSDGDGNSNSERRRPVPSVVYPHVPPQSYFRKSNLWR